jgi:hypothetical protein
MHHSAHETYFRSERLNILHEYMKLCLQEHSPCQFFNKNYDSVQSRPTQGRWAACGHHLAVWPAAKVPFYSLKHVIMLSLCLKKAKNLVEKRLQNVFTKRSV